VLLYLVKRKVKVDLSELKINDLVLLKVKLNGLDYALALGLW